MRIDPKNHASSRLCIPVSTDDNTTILHKNNSSNIRIIHSHSLCSQSTSSHRNTNFLITTFSLFLLMISSLLPHITAQTTPKSPSSTGTSRAPDSSSTSSSSPYDSNPFAWELDFVAGNGIEYTVTMVFMIWGLICCFFGVRLFKFSLFLITWIGIGGVTYYLSMLISHQNSKSSFIAAMIIGSLFGFAVIKLYKLGLFVAGAFAAFCLWSYFLTLFPHAVPSGGMYTVLAIVLLVGGVLAWYFEKIILLFATPIIGVFLFSQGLSKYQNNPSLRLNVYAVLHNEVYCDTRECMGLYAGFAAMTLLGIAVQWYITSGLRNRVSFTKIV